MDRARQIHEQKKQDKQKIYSVHETDVNCISKGKAHKKYEFGSKVSVVMSHRKNLILNCEALANNPFDGHSLEQALQEAENLSCLKIERALVDKGYRGHGIKNRDILISGRGKTVYFKKLLRRRQAIEPIIGQVKGS